MKSHNNGFNDDIPTEPTPAATDENLISDIEVDNRFYPKSNRVLTGFVLSVLGAGAYVCDALMQKFPPELGLPYNVVVDFYRLTLVKPAQTLIDVWQWLSDLHLTESSNLNLTISVIGMIFYTLVVLELYAIFIEVIGIMLARLGRYDRPDILGAFQLYFLPALMVLAYFLIIHAILLYGDTSTFDY